MIRDFKKLRSNYISSKAKRHQFRLWHKRMVELSRYSDLRNEILPSIEIGCGVTPMSDNFPDIISSDIEENPYSKKTIDALSIPYKKNSIDSIFALNCFHHISNKNLFLKEAYRVLSKEGTLVLLEPSYSFLSRMIYPFLFKEETYDIKSSVNSLRTIDPMTGANQAASYICFIKSRDDFLSNSGFQLEKIEHCKNSLAYILSGGINFPQLMPEFVIKNLSYLALPSNIFSLHWIIKLKKY